MMMMNDFAVPFFLLMQRVNECNTTQTTLLYLFIFRCDLIFFYTITDFCILYDVLFCSSCVPFDKYK